MRVVADSMSAQLQRSLSVASGEAVEIDRVLEACLEELVRRGPVNGPNDLRELIPDLDAELRRFVLIELIKLDMAMTAPKRMTTINRWANNLLV